MQLGHSFEKGLHGADSSLPQASEMRRRWRQERPLDVLQREPIFHFLTYLGPHALLHVVLALETRSIVAVKMRNVATDGAKPAEGIQECFRAQVQHDLNLNRSGRHTDEQRGPDLDCLVKPQGTGLQDPQARIVHADLQKGGMQGDSDAWQISHARCNSRRRPPETNQAASNYFRYPCAQGGDPKIF